MISPYFLLVGGSAAYQQLPGRRKATNEPGGVATNFSQTQQEPAVIDGTLPCDLLADRREWSAIQKLGRRSREAA